jgi:DNA-binding transcriptional MerR regulator
MTGYRISQAAELAGFTPSELRFYEGEGLLPSPARSATGYRNYDDAAISRLRFVHRARQLGLGLDAIRDLVAVWDAGACAPVQHGFAQRIAAHRQDIAARLVELTALHQELLAAERTVIAADSDLACGPGCACLASPDLAASPTVSGGEPARGATPPRRAVDVTLSVTPAGPDTPLLACTLTGSDMPQRLQDWADLVSAATARETIPAGERLEFPSTSALAARIGELCALEQACCPFFTFALTFTSDRITLQVSAPAGAAELVTALLAGAA